MPEYIEKERVIEWFRPYGHVEEGIPYYGLVTDIREMKPADVAIVRHGQWISVANKRDRICSRCLHNEPYKNADDDAEVFEFCPHCGAKMDGGDSNAADGNV